MPQVKGNLEKMLTEAKKPIQYKLPVGKQTVEMNNLRKKSLKLEYTGTINCRSCGAVTPKSYGQGYCYSCFLSVPETAPCILHPEKCRAHEGIYRDKEFAEKNCLQPHYVYLALTSGLKVGVTRQTQIPTRWIDQGAVKALKLAKTPNRNTAGRIEVALKNHISDKTSWQKMLKNDISQDIDLKEEKEKAKKMLPKEFQKFITFDKKIMDFHYPAEGYPEKVKSLSFDKSPVISGTLSGIKGQYLIFDDGRVLNIRKHTSYEIILSF